MPCRQYFSRTGGQFYLLVQTLFSFVQSMVHINNTKYTIYVDNQSTIRPVAGQESSPAIALFLYEAF